MKQNNCLKTKSFNQCVAQRSIERIFLDLMKESNKDVECNLRAEYLGRKTDDKNIGGMDAERCSETTKST